jgi:hypothetical protein
LAEINDHKTKMQEKLNELLDIYKTLEETEYISSSYTREQILDNITQLKTYLGISGMIGGGSTINTFEHPNKDGKRGLVKILKPTKEESFVFIGDLGDSVAVLINILNDLVNKNIISADGMLTENYNLVFIGNKNKNVLINIFKLFNINNIIKQKVFIVRSDDSDDPDFNKILYLLPIALEIKNPNNDDKFIYVSDNTYQIIDGSTCKDDIKSKVATIRSRSETHINSYIIKNYKDTQCIYNKELIDNAIVQGYQFTIGNNNENDALTKIFDTSVDVDNLVDLKTKIKSCASGKVSDSDKYKCKSYIADIHIDKKSNVKINEDDDIPNNVKPVVTLKGYNIVASTSEGIYGYGILIFSKDIDCESNDVFVCVKDIVQGDLDSMRKDVDTMIELLDEIAETDKSIPVKTSRARSEKHRKNRKNTTYKNRR